MKFFRDVTEEDLWFCENKTVKIAEEKVVVKVYNGEKFEGSVVIPTALYPLNGKMKVFDWRNTESISDKEILKIIDGVKYNIGRCYTYSEQVCNALKASGYDATQYVGWMFYGQGFPTHHSWVVLDGKYLIDLSDDDYLFQFNLKENNINLESMSKEEQYEVIISFNKWRLKTDIPNSVRCCHIGEVYPRKIYVGSECDRRKGIDIFNELTDKYPNHPCLAKGTDSRGLTPLQREMKKNGIL